MIRSILLPMLGTGEGLGDRRSRVASQPFMMIEMHRRTDSVYMTLCRAWPEDEGGHAQERSW